MKKLPEIKNSCADIYGLIRSNVQHDILMAAIKWKIFDYLKEPSSAETVAERLGFRD